MYLKWSLLWEVSAAVAWPAFVVQMLWSGFPRILIARHMFTRTTQSLPSSSNPILNKYHYLLLRSFFFFATFSETNTVARLKTTTARNSSPTSASDTVISVRLVLC